MAGNLVYGYGTHSADATGMRVFLVSPSLLSIVLMTAVCDLPHKPPQHIPSTLPPVAAAGFATDAPKPSCVHFGGEARYRRFAYDHIVHLVSSCHRVAACRVSTDVNPAVVVVAVEPGEQLEVVTLRSSPTSDFAPLVQCSRGTH
jgi:hypothetical protein